MMLDFFNNEDDSKQKAKQELENQHDRTLDDRVRDRIFVLNIELHYLPLAVLISIR